MNSQHSPLRGRSISLTENKTVDYAQIRESEAYLASRKEYLSNNVRKDQYGQAPRSPVRVHDTFLTQDNSKESQPLRMRSRSGSPDLEVKNLINDPRYSRHFQTQRPKLDTGGYTKHPVRGPDAFKTTRPKRELFSDVDRVESADLDSYPRFSSLRMKPQVDHTNSVLEKARSNRIFQQNYKQYEEKVKNLLHQENNSQEFQGVNRSVHIENLDKNQNNSNQSQFNNRKTHSKSVQGRFAPQKYLINETDTRNTAEFPSKSSTQIQNVQGKKDFQTASKYSMMNMSQSTALQSAQTKSQKVTSRLDKKQFGSKQSMQRPVGTVGYTNNSIIDDVSFFEGQTIQEAPVSNIGNVIATQPSKSKQRQLENDGPIQKEITPQVLGLAKSIREKKVSPPKQLSEYQQRIENKYEQLLHKKENQKINRKKSEEKQASQIDIEIEPLKTGMLLTTQNEGVKKSILKERGSSFKKKKSISFSETAGNLKPSGVFSDKKKKRSRSHSKERSQSAGRQKTCPWHGRGEGSLHRSNHSSEFSPVSGKSQNLSRTIMNDPETFDQQCLLYKATHQQFMFTKPKIGSRADRVYSYYSNTSDWRGDRYLHVSQEADYKGLQSREGRKLELAAYHKKMTYVPLKKDPANVPCKLLSHYVPPTQKKHGDVIQAMRDKMLRNSSMVAAVSKGMPNLKPKKSLQKYEIGAQAQQQVKKLIPRHEIGGAVAAEYRTRVKPVVQTK